jgi:hypothetical protein
MAPHNKFVFFTVVISPFRTILENSKVVFILFNIAYPKIIRIVNLPMIEEKKKRLIGLKINMKMRTIETTVQIQVVLQEFT